MLLPRGLLFFIVPSIRRHAAPQIDADMLVVNSRSRGGLYEAINGSVSSWLVHNCSRWTAGVACGYI